MKKLTISGLSALLGASVGAVAVGTMQKPKTVRRADHTQKMTEFYRILIEWLRIRQEGKSLVSYFIQNGYKTVAIYVIDKNADAIYVDVDVVTPEDFLEEVDVIVVTAIHYFDEIESMLGEKVDYPIISLEDIIYEI